MVTTFSPEDVFAVCQRLTSSGRDVTVPAVRVELGSRSSRISPLVREWKTFFGRPRGWTPLDEAAPAPQAGSIEAGTATLTPPPGNATSGLRPNDLPDKKEGGRPSEQASATPTHHEAPAMPLGTTTRLQIDMPPNAMTSLNRLMEAREAGTHTEVIRAALRVLEHLQRAADQGQDIILRSADGVERRIIIL
ncbi:DNA-binding protein [Azospirillum doebereinerae]|uniref:DNA-binding protein n=1 Tax=Azospirillum doebereinerae TaxID=92933 RepID=UPI001EE60691|nr:DNA-binding protein [Azospirillum doebereinerae]MCG5238176.1 DNA-binding protein [Azospirillum doebereinerae]